MKKKLPEPLCNCLIVNLLFPVFDYKLQEVEMGMLLILVLVESQTSLALLLCSGVYR